MWSFCCYKEKSVIKNLNIVDSFFGGEYCSSVGSFVGYCEGRIENCYSSATLYGDDCAGIAAGARGSMYEMETTHILKIVFSMVK